MDNTKYKIGYTTGVFDLFHIGHLNLLMKAKERCEYLIVGVSTDELVQEYKNKTPMIPFEERLAIVAACKYVDKVVPQKSMDKMVAWEQLKFEVMFHGDEWKNTPLYNKYIDQFDAVGVKIEFLPHTKGICSTNLATKISEKKD